MRKGKGIRQKAELLFHAPVLLLDGLDLRFVFCVLLIEGSRLLLPSLFKGSEQFPFFSSFCREGVCGLCLSNETLGRATCRLQSLPSEENLEILLSGGLPAVDRIMDDSRMLCRSTLRFMLRNLLVDIFLESNRFWSELRYIPFLHDRGKQN